MVKKLWKIFQNMFPRSNEEITRGIRDERQKNSNAPIPIGIVTPDLDYTKRRNEKRREE